MRVVLKLGGRVARDAAGQVHGWREAGYEVVVVHGAGPQITAELEARGVAARFVDGRRVTTQDVLEVVRSSLRAVNAEVCAAIGPEAVGLQGDEIGLTAVPVPALGLVGDPVPSAPAAVLDALDRGLVPVVAPLAAGPLNVNADEAAAALAVGLAADRIAFVSDVPGVLLDDRVADVLGAADADRMLGEGRFEGGIVPKLAAAIRATRGGVEAEIGGTRVVA
jgi:acetylglutamate kinase